MCGDLLDKIYSFFLSKAVRKLSSNRDDGKPSADAWKFHEVVYEFTRPQSVKRRNFVMPAWIAGIEVRKDASGNIHVSLDSSTPCWNDVIGAA